MPRNIVIGHLINTHQKKFCITTVLRVPELLHINGIEIDKNNISALCIAHKNQKIACCAIIQLDFFNFQNDDTLLRYKGSNLPHFCK